MIDTLSENALSEHNEFYKTLIRLAVPISLQNLIASSLNMVDMVMVGQLGETAIASVGLANQFFFLLNLLLFGVNSGAAIFTAQFWGKRDIQNIKRVLGLNIILGVLAAFLFTLVAVSFPQQVLSVFSKDKDVIALGGEFLRITSFSYILTAVSFSFAFTLRSIENVRLPMVVSFISLGINTALNYLLILGNFGFPAQGVRGAAYATVVARVVEVFAITIIVYVRKYEIAAKFREMFDISLDFMKKFLKTTIPVILNECLWSVGVTMYSVVYAHMGTGIIASINIASTVERIATVLFFGLGHSCAVMVGNQIGANNEDKAFRYAKRFIILGPALGAVAGLLLIFSRGWVLSVYNVSPDVNAAAARILLVMAVVMAARMFNTIMIVGILRSGGDTKFSLIIDVAGTWVVAVPMAFLGGLVWKLPIEWVYLLIALEDLLKLALGVWRFASKKWINNLVRHI